MTTSLIPAPEATEQPLSLVEQQSSSLSNASWLAKEIKEIIEKNDLAKALGGKKKHVELEAWTTVARIHNEAPHSKFVRSFKDDSGAEIVEAHAWVTDASGKTVAEADAFVSTSEKNWSGKPFYARASMAQTRALSKALRLRHSWIMVMAGYEATPAEEMDGIEKEPRKAAAKVKDAPVREQTAEGTSVLTGEAVEGSPEPLISTNVDQAPLAEGLQKVFAQVIRVAEKKGNKADGSTYTRYGVLVNWPDVGERWLNTFHASLGKVARECVGTSQTIIYSESQWNGKTQYDLEGFDR